MLPFAPSLTFKLLMLLICTLALFGAGLYVGVEWELGKQARLDAKERSAVIDSLVKQRADDQEGLMAVHELLVDEQEARRRDGLVWERKVRDAKPQSLAVCTDQPQGGGTAAASPDGDRVALTLEFVGLWNDALCEGNASAACRSRTDDPAFSAGFALPKDILGNVRANAEACAADRARLAGWQLWAKKRGFIRGE